MAMCRWSTDGYRCDLYIYESTHGGWTCHIALRRHVGLDTVGEDPTNSERFDQCPPKGHPDREEWMQAWAEDYRIYTERLRSLKTEDIDHPLAGRTVTRNTAAELADWVEAACDGLSYPDWLVEELRDE